MKAAHMAVSEHTAKAKSRARRSSRIVALFLLSWPLLAWCAARALITEAEVGQVDAIVVLGGAATYVERSRHAAALFHEGRAPLIILTNDGMPGGWSHEKNRTMYFIERAADELLSMGIPAAKIKTLMAPVSGTYEEALLLRDYAAAHDIKSLLVVTSAYHSRRALWTWRRVFRESRAAATTTTIGLSAVGPGLQSPTPSVWWLSWAGWQMVAGEYLKFAYYLLRYH